MCPNCGSVEIVSNEEHRFQPLCLECGWTGPVDEMAADSWCDPADNNISGPAKGLVSFSYLELRPQRGRLDFQDNRA